MDLLREFYFNLIQSIKFCFVRIVRLLESAFVLFYKFSLLCTWFFTFFKTPISRNSHTLYRRFVCLCGHPAPLPPLLSVPSLWTLWEKLFLHLIYNNFHKFLVFSICPVNAEKEENEKEEKVGNFFKIFKIICDSIPVYSIAAF